MSAPMYDTLHTTNQFRTALDRHTLHHPEDERHPLYELAVALLELAVSFEEDPWEPPDTHKPPPPAPEPEPEPATPGTELRCIDMPAGTTCYTYHHTERHGHHIKPSVPLKRDTRVWCVVSTQDHSRFDPLNPIRKDATPFRNRDHAIAWHAAIR